MSQQLYEQEALAIQGKIGIWEKSAQILNQDTAQEHIGTFQIVEGKIYSASMRSNTIYANFTRDWKTDFTIRVKKENRILFSRSGHNPLSWNGKEVQVRGYVEDYNGPMITVTHPSQIKILDAKP